MRSGKLLLFSFLLVPFPAYPQSTASQKNTLSLDGAWGLQASGDTSTINVPASIPFFGGISNWSRTFTMNLPHPPLVAYLDFGGIANTATVKLNGVQVGSLVAFTRARIDVTQALNFSGLNTLELAIDDRLQPTTIPGGPTDYYEPVLGSIAYALPVAWSPDPGIVRDVSLIYSDHPVVTSTLAAQTVSSDLSEVSVKITVNEKGTATSNVLALVAIALNGAIVASCQTQVTPSGDLTCSISVKNPLLWSPSAPNLYDFWVVLADGGGVADVVHDQTGFRRFESRGNQLFLNNQPLFLRGITRHDIYANGSFAADEPTIRQDLQTLKNLGVNYVRSIHYPPDPKLALIADQIGIMLSEEIPAYAEFSNDSVLQTAQTMMQAMIERDFNRPSVIFWISGNGNILYGPYLQQTGAAAKAADPTRPVSFVVDDPSATTPEAMQADLEIVSSSGMDLYLQNGYWWPWVVAEFVPNLPVDKPVIITEWAGSEGSNRGPIGAPGTAAFPGWTFDGTGAFPEELQATTILYMLEGWLPYVNCTAPQSPCVSGLTFFNYQDVSWPGLPFFSTGHYTMLRNGLFFEDRTPKPWPVAIFQYGMALLPR
jgi:hypothetical protein